MPVAMPTQSFHKVYIEALRDAIVGIGGEQGEQHALEIMCILRLALRSEFTKLQLIEVERIAREVPVNFQRNNKLQNKIVAVTQLVGMLRDRLAQGGYTT
jgi:hypothetical protein